MESKVQKKVREVHIFEEQKVEISDCIQVVSSTDKDVVAKVESGFVEVVGSKLVISKLLPEGGLLVITGEIGGVKFENKMTKKSLFKKVFK